MSVCVLSALLFSAGAVAQPPEWAQGRILVAPNAGLPAGKFEAILRRHGGRSAGAIGQIGVHIVNVPGQAEEAVVTALSRNPHVQFAELDMLVEPVQVLPNDPKYASAWHLPRIQAPAAWERVLGDNVVVAILDTGVDASHVDLAANLVPGWNTASNNADTADVHGHGTMVAGTVAATSNNGIGVTSVAWNARLMPVRITDRTDGYAYWSAVAAGLDWATQHGARVANVSYDVSGSSTISSAAQRLRSNGGVVVVAGGNSGSDPGYQDNPYMISVSATNSSDVKASWSSYGQHVDVAAPGAGIWTTKRGGSYGSVSGTSFASPTTAGVVALVMSANPRLTPGEIENVLEGSTDDLGDPGWDGLYGHGRVNAGKAVIAATQITTQDTQPPRAAIDTPAEQATVSGTVAVGVTATDDVGIARVDLYVDGSPVGTDNTEPYAYSWDSTTAADGWVRMVAYAYDESGNEGGSTAVNVLVDNVPDPVDAEAPEVTISEPADGSTVDGRVKIRISAGDNIGVTAIRVYIDGTLKSATSTNPLSFTWNTRKVSAGDHVIRAEADDGAANTGAMEITVTKSAGSGSRNGRKL